MKSLLLTLLIFGGFEIQAQTKTFRFVFLHKKLDAAQLTKAESDKIMEGHMANINRLAKESKLVAAGPFEGGGGMFILNTTSVDEAKQWLSTDPGVQAHRWDIEILSYKPRIGSVCVVSEPYEMVMYQFIRFKPDISKATLNQDDSFQKHDVYLQELEKAGNVVTEGIFGEHDGGILILRGELEKEIVEGDPAVQEGLLELDLKQLWIAKGSFCEK
ncbi:MAG TPA: YciI family protein [Chryseolinea sp.]|nr:YciI family protein [Chryseolinea sp.]